MGNNTLQDIRNRDVEVELSGEVYKVNFDLNAFAMLEDEYGSVDVLMEKIANSSAKATIALLWAGLQRNHPGITKEQVGALAGFGDIPTIARAIYGGVQANLPQKKGNTAKNR